MRLKRLLGFVIGACAVAVLAGSAGAAATRAPTKHADLSTNAAVKTYLRSHGISPRGVVIQRGARNYAGPGCPGKGWACTRSRRVVQITSGHGRNRFRCAAARCVVVQATKSALATNSASCIRTTGITQSCSISQLSGSANNQAVIVEIATKLSGLTQNASQTATIVQTAGSGANTACVLQTTTIDGSTVAKRGAPVNVNLEAHQSISVTQDSASGGNTVKNATSRGGCASSAVNQSQTVTSTATGSTSITQNENALSNGPNLQLDIAQNQSNGFFGSATGENNAAFSQTNTLSATAVTPAGPVNQTQSSDSGGIQATVNQFSHDMSTANATQTETQCVHAQSGGTPSCTPGSPPAYSLTQLQFGPAKLWNSRTARTSRGRHFDKVRKGPCCSTQADFPNNVFNVHQMSTQNADNGATQTNQVEGDCTTSGNCVANQQTNIDGQATNNTSTGKNVSTTINCTGSSCIAFDGSPGTNAPPPTLGPYTMTPFGADPQPIGTTVTGVNDPAGSITFSQPLLHSTVGNGWATWSHGYTGDVYSNFDGSAITITMPAGTKAFYLYAEPNAFNVFDVQATAQDGTTSGPVQVQGNSGAKYFGFYGTGNATIATVTVSTTDTSGLGIGEFGIFPAAAIP